jgi:predicted nucleic acid-binding protein
MNWLLDTNVVSELRRPHLCHENVLRWARHTIGDKQFLSVVTLGEIRSGIERRRLHDEAAAEILENWLAMLRLRYARHILKITEAIADRWGRLSSQRDLSDADGLIAATALECNFRLATRNVDDFKDTGVQLFNPWEYDS